MFLKRYPTSKIFPVVPGTFFLKSFLYGPGTQAFEIFLGTAHAKPW